MIIINFDKLKREIKKELDPKGIVVDDITYTKNSGNYNVLSITLDKDGGIDLDTIVEATNIINPIVDKLDLIKESYILDVVSKERG